ncbi:hypothetical protein G647_07000 [Cladophialophora carrionii CBS 160.54]|uniref:Uncharacterized protein n=1 Tax=Cladophialophora carrionii CBS 160.54 TaxID=1279043 RepID=V9D2Y9_9EURO|nr:uncharacterized protein G647_07000 [Cladophialophora carrionii CBS 160.54]ETI20658.1 hypothetical protein G647_07000 [Cladophialophora carrionii CBS 160.54]
MADWTEQDLSEDRISQLLEELKQAVHEYGELHRAQGVDENEHQPALHQHSKYIYGLSKEYLGHDPKHASVRKLYKWFGQTVRGQFPGHRNLRPEQHKTYHRHIAVGQDDDGDMSDMDPALMDDSDSEYGGSHGDDHCSGDDQDEQQYDDGYHDKHHEDYHGYGGRHDRHHHGQHEGWNENGEDAGQGEWDGELGDDGQDDRDYVHDNGWNDQDEDGQYSHHGEGDYRDGGDEHEHGDQHQHQGHNHEHQHHHQHQGHDHRADDY